MLISGERWPDLAYIALKIKSSRDGSPEGILSALENRKIGEGGVGDIRVGVPEGGLRIESVMLDGYGPHGGPNSIVIGPGITILTGDNGTGKTHVLDAIHWCLFGQRWGMDRWYEEDPDSCHDVVNWNRGPDGMVKVKVIFRWGSGRYRVERSLDREGMRHSVWRCDARGRWRRSPVPTDISPDILPFLLFAGESVHFLASEDPFTREGILKRALMGISGASRVEGMRAAIAGARDIILRRLERAAAEVPEQEEEISRLRGRADVLSDELEGVRVEIEELGRGMRLSKGAYDRALRSIAHLGTLSDRERASAREAVLEEMYQSRLRDYLASAGREVLRPLAEKALGRILSEKELMLKRRLRYGALEAQASVVREVIKRRSCICSNPVGRSGMGRERLDALLGRLEEGKEEVSDWGRELPWMSDPVLEGVRRLLGAPSVSRAAVDEVVTLIKDSREASERFSAGVADTEGLMQSYLLHIREYESSRARMDAERKRLAEAMGALKAIRSRISTMERRMAKRLGTSRGRGGLLGDMEMLDRAIEQSEECISNLIECSRSRLEGRTSEILERVDGSGTLGPSVIHPETFRIGRRSREGSRVLGLSSLSAGERELLSLSLLCSFPLLAGGCVFLDSPFAYIDRDKRSRIIGKLSSMVDSLYISTATGTMDDGSLASLTDDDRTIVTYRLEWDSNRKGTVLEKGDLGEVD